MKSLQLKPQSEILKEGAVGISQMHLTQGINTVFPWRGVSLNLVPWHKDRLIILQLRAVTFTGRRRQGIGIESRGRARINGRRRGTVVGIGQEIRSARISPSGRREFPPLPRWSIFGFSITTIIVIVPVSAWIILEISKIIKIVKIGKTPRITIVSGPVSGVIVEIVSSKRGPVIFVNCANLWAVVSRKRHNSW